MLSVPVTGTLAQPKLKRETSRAPDNFRQDDATVHDPTTLPPHAATLLHVPGSAPAPAPAPPGLGEPPLPFAPPDEEPAVFPAPALELLPEPLLQAASVASELRANTATSARYPLRIMTFQRNPLWGLSV